MRLLPALLLNLVVAGGAVVIYDQVRGEPTTSGGGLDASTDLDDLRARIARLESDRPVELRSDGAADATLRRLEALEARLKAFEEKPTRTAPAPSPTDDADQPVARLEPGEPSTDEVERFRKLQKAARARDAQAKRTAYVKVALDKAGVRLSDTQRAKVVAAQAAFGERYNEIWSEAKSSSGAQGEDVDWTTIIRETNEVIQTEFASQVSSFLPQADAEAVAGALYPSRGK